MNKTVSYQIHMIIIRQKQTSYLQTSTQKGKAIDLSSCNEINTHTALKTTLFQVKRSYLILNEEERKQENEKEKPTETRIKTLDGGNDRKLVDL